MPSPDRHEDQPDEVPPAELAVADDYVDDEPDPNEDAQLESDTEEEKLTADDDTDDDAKSHDGDDKDDVKVREKEQFADDIALPGANIENVKMLSKRIPVTYFRQALSDRVDARHMMRDFVLHVPFVIAFIFFMFGRRSISEEFFFSEATKNYLVHENLPPTSPVPGSDPNGMPYFPKNFLEIGNYGDIYDWAEAVLAPRLFTNDPAGRDIQNRKFGGQNQLLGAVRIRSKHVRNNTCTPNPAWYPDNETNFPRICYGPLKSKNERKEPIEGNTITYNWTDNCNDWPLQWISGKYAFYDCAGYTFDIPFNTTLDDALKLITSFRENRFFNTETVRLFMVEFFSYNPAVNTYMSVKLVVEITEGGGFLPWPRIRPFVIFPGTPGWIVYNIFFLLMVLFYIQRFIVDWRRNARVTRSKVAFLLSVWNLMQLANLLLFIPVYVLFFRWVYYSNQVKVLYPDPEEGEVNPDVAAYSGLLGAVAELYQTQIYLNAVNTIFTFLVTLKFAQLNERLSILQRTVGTAVQPLLAVLIIFVIVVTSYAIAGTLIFGTGVEAFRNVDQSFVSLFRVLVGDFDYWTLWGENRALAFIYFWSFVILGLFILLNFIVAIMMGAFSEENAKLKPKSVAVLITETVDRQRNTLIARIKKAFHVACSSKQMPEDTLLEKLNEYLEDYTKEAVAADDEFEIDDFQFGRYDLFKIIPRAELEDIGDEYLDGMWFAIVDDYNNTQDDEADVDKEAATQHVYEFVKEAISEYFNDFRLKMFGDEKFMAQLDNRRKYLDDETRENAHHQYTAISQVPAVPIRLKNGKVPADLLQYLTELAARSAAVQKRMQLSRELTLDATDECPPPVRRDAIPHALPPMPPPFSGQHVLDAHGELPDLDDAKRKALRLTRTQKKNAPARRGNLAASVSEGELEEAEGSINDPPRQPRTFPAAPPIAERIVDEINGNELPSGGEWLATDSDAYVWSRSRQCFLHMPSGHFCAMDGKQWYVPESGKKVWMPAIERRVYLDKQAADAAEKERREAAERASRECGPTVTLSAAEARREAENTAAARWVSSINDVPLPKPQNVKSGLPVNPDWKPTRDYAYSPPPVGVWSALEDADGFFFNKDHGVYFFAHVGHYYDPVTRLWFVPTLGKWIPVVEHEQVLSQLAMTGKY